VIIKTLLIKGFKKFRELEVKFNDEISVIVGENKSGKSSLLLALDIALNQSVFNRADSSLDRYLNKEDRIENGWREEIVSEILA
jgi:hypothetical protein